MKTLHLGRLDHLLAVLAISALLLHSPRFPRWPPARAITSSLPPRRATRASPRSRPATSPSMRRRRGRDRTRTRKVLAADAGRGRPSGHRPVGRR